VLGVPERGGRRLHLEADLAMNEATVAKTAPRKARVGRFKPGDQLRAFLIGL